MTNNLTKILKEKGISKSEFSREMNVTYVTVNNWCKATDMTVGQMTKIADKLNVNISDVFEF